MKTHTLLLSLIALATLATTTTAQEVAPAEVTEPEVAASETAAPPATAEPEDRLQIRLGLYTWFSSLSNTVSVGNGDETTTDIPFSDIFPALDFANFGHLEIQKGKWGAFSELDFIKLSDNAEFRKLGGLPFKISADLAIKQTTLELGAMRTFQGKRVGFDAMLGARYFRMESDVHLGLLESSVTKDWVDPLVGARLRFRLAERWNASIRGDLAGFGVGSELTTNAVAILSYKISERYDVGFGYRYMDIEYENDALKVDMKTYGPVVGMSIRF